MGTDQIPVRLHAADSITRAGVIASLRARPEIRFVAAGEDIGPSSSSQVALVMLERFDSMSQQLLRKLRQHNSVRTVLVAGDIGDTDLLNMIGSGVSAMIRRSEATPDTLVRLIKATAAGEGTLPPDVLGRLLDRMTQMQKNVHSHGFAGSTISERETKVLRLLADGCETKEVARRLSYSERTVKSIIHDVTNRFQLRNRTHAVAFALREGLI